jgi:predicted NBD/HSP70 family sugar kinase
VSTPEALRLQNVATVLDALRHRSGVSRTDLARVTGLSRSTVISIVDTLDRQGFIVERNAEPTGDRGRPPALIRLHPSAGVALGVFVGREDVRVALVDLSLTVLAQHHATFLLDTPAATVIDLIGRLADDVLSDSGHSLSDLVGVGVGLPSPIAPETSDVDAAILHSWAGRPAQSELARRLGAPVVFENDANLEALAELAVGAAQGLRHVVYATVSWGIGGAVVVDGRVRRGRRGNAGELAHIQVRADGPVCRCGRRGCLGNFASGHVLADALGALHGRAIDLAAVRDMAIGGDAGAQRLLTDAGRELGAVLAAVGNCIDPEAYIVGGELAAPGSPLIDGVRAGIADRALPASASVPVRPAALGPVGGALGAAALIIRSDAVREHFANLAVA